MDIQQNNVAVLHFNLVNQDGSTIFIRKTKLATFNLINPSAVSVPITDIGFDATLNQCWIRIPKASNATTGQYYGVLNIVDDDWGTYTTSKIKVYSVVSDADDDTKSVVFTATCIATQVTNPSGGNSPYYNTTTSTWWQYSDTLKAFEDTGVGNLIQYITKNVQHLKDGTGNGSIVTCLDDEISANNIATGLCSTDLGKNNENRGESCVALGENNYIAEGVSNATAIAGAQPSAVDVFAVGDKTAGHKNIFEINKFGDIYFRPDSSRERPAILQDILDGVIKNVVYDSSKYSLTVTFYSSSENNNKIKTYDLSGLKTVLKEDAVKEISVNQATAVMTVNMINGSSQQIQLPTGGGSADTHFKGQISFSNFASIATASLIDQDYYICVPDSIVTSINVSTINGTVNYSTPFYVRWVKRDADTTMGTAAVAGWTIQSVVSQQDSTLSSIQPFSYLESSEVGTFWTNTNANSFAIAVITNFKVVTNKVKIFIVQNGQKKIRFAIYKVTKVGNDFTLDLVAQTQLYEGTGTTGFVDIPFETIATLDSDTLYYFAFGCSGNGITFVGKTFSFATNNIQPALYSDGNAFDSNTYAYKSQYPKSVFTGSVFIPYFKII